MLGFILSKMQMLLFAVGIAVVALLFYNFVVNIGLTESANSLISLDSKVVSSQIGTNSLCSFEKTTIPDMIKYGFDNRSFYYELGFSTKTFGTGDNQSNMLIMSILEHKTRGERNLIAAKNISTSASFVLVDSNFLLEGSGLENSFDKPEVSYYPRAASGTELAASSPNAFVALKSTDNGKQTIYIIPCSTLKEPSNCLRNIVRVGCYLLKKNGDPTANTLVSSCFNITTKVCQLDKFSGGYTWNDCRACFPEIIG